MRWSQDLYKRVQIIIDAVSFLIALMLSIYLKHGSIIFPKSPKDFLYLVLIFGFWFLAAHECKLYRNRIYKKFPEEILFNIYANFLFVILLSAFLFLAKSDYANLFSFSVVVVIHLFISLSAKYYIRKKQHLAFEAGSMSDTIVIIGHNPASIAFQQTLKDNAYYGYKCIGIIDDQFVQDEQVTYLGNTNNLETVLRNQHIDEVIIALPSDQNELIRKCIDICDQLKVKVRLMPSVIDLTSKVEEVDTLGSLSVINLNELPLDKFENKLFKSFFDKAFAALFFILIGWWLFPIIIILIKLDSKGPIIYTQERWGFNNKPIICYKFRTMHLCETEEAFKQTTRDDPRVTSIGKFLRKYSLDELPQFWNVLKGDMSVVGPRPHPTPMNLESMQIVANYLKRHMVKPGITGWAQINGYRGEVNTKEQMEKRVQYDLYYTHRWSFSLDLQIILQTIIKMVKDNGAY